MAFSLREGGHPPNRGLREPASTPGRPGTLMEALWACSTRCHPGPRQVSPWFRRGVTWSRTGVTLVPERCHPGPGQVSPWSSWLQVTTCLHFCGSDSGCCPRRRQVHWNLRATRGGPHPSLVPHSGSHAGSPRPPSQLSPGTQGAWAGRAGCGPGLGVLVLSTRRALAGALSGGFVSSVTFPP